MAPIPIEGHHPSLMAGPISGMHSVAAQAPPGAGTISLGMLIDFGIQQTYHELTVLAELMARKNDIEKKIAIVQFASKTRQLFVRILALVKWASSASKVEKCSSIMAFLDKQSMLFVETADVLSRMARETLVNARLPNFHLPCAVEVLTTGTYLRLPTCIRDKIVPPEQITSEERKFTLYRLNQIIQHRLVTSDLPHQMRNLTIENGRVTFHVEHEFKCSLTMMGDNLSIPWRLLKIDILVEDKETGDGKALVHSLQVQYIEQLIQSRLIENSSPLHDIYNCLHSFCQSLQLEVLHSQAVRLINERLGDYIKIEEYNAGKNLTVSYWREVQSKEIEDTGFRITVQTDPSNSCNPLLATHLPKLNSNESAEADRAIKCDHLSIEKLLVQTIYIRTKQRLNELKDCIKKNIENMEWSVSGSPAILQVSVLQPCLRAEQLLISIDTHAGIFVAHIPKYDIPIMNDIQQALNTNDDAGRTKFIDLLTKLRFWITYRRCEKSLSHLPAIAINKLPLIIPDDHEINKLGPFKLFVKLRKHPNCFLVVNIVPDLENLDDVAQEFFMLIVNPTTYTDEETSVADSALDMNPKAFLRISVFLKLDSFSITHGSCTSVEASQETKMVGLGKRNGSRLPYSADAKRAKHPAYFIPKLAHVVAVCDERVPFASLTEELSKRGIAHQGIQVEAHGSNLTVGVVKMPEVVGAKKSTVLALQNQLMSCTFRIQGKTTRCWLVEYIFCKCPLPTSTAQELDWRRPVYFLYELSTTANIHKVVDSFIQDWTVMCQLYEAIQGLTTALDQDASSKFVTSIEVKSYTYKRLVLKYGPNKAYIITVQKRAPDKGFHLTFGIGNHTASAMNPHSAISQQLHHIFNHKPSINNLIHLLQETLPVLNSLYKLSVIPMLGIITSRPKVPVSTFIIVPQSPTHYRITYRSMYCLDVQCRGDGLVAIRDGAFSLFDKGKPLNEIMPIQGLKSFLSKYADESSMSGNSMMQRRGQNQSDDVNQPSPQSSTLDPMDSLMGPGSASPAQRSQDSTGLRFTHPMTPPSVSSNPHTPASPHQSVMSQQSFAASPATSSFPLASPPSLQHNINPSPSMMHINTPSPATMLSVNSPGNPLHAPSPGGAFLPTPSPSSQTPIQHMQSPAQSFMTVHGEAGSPFPPASYAAMPSPAAPSIRWANSPSMPGPSPVSRSGMAQSPGGGHFALQSPQAGSVPQDPNAVGSTRVLPQRAWAAAIPTLLSNESFAALCMPGAIQISLGHMTNGNLSPLERYMGCSYMKRNILRVLQNDESLSLLPSQEPSGIFFKVESLHCKVTLNPIHSQTLHVKLNPTPEFIDQWLPEDLLVLEKFFDTKVACHPYKPNAFVAFCKIITTPFRILKECVTIMKMEMVPDRMAKWAIEWCTTTPVAAPPIAPPGMNGVIVINNKILFYFQLTRIGLQLPPGTEPQSLIVPIVYDMANNVTHLADKRDPNAANQPTAPYAIISNTLKRFNEVNPRSPNECSFSPSIRELITNLVIPLHNAP